MRIVWRNDKALPMFGYSDYYYKLMVKLYPSLGFTSIDFNPLSRFRLRMFLCAFGVGLRITLLFLSYSPPNYHNYYSR